SSIGPRVREFEQRFADWVGCKYGVSTTSGTTALHLAVATLGMGMGNEVIIPTFTMVATCNAVLYQNARPVLVDAMPDTWCMDVDQIQEKITKNTRAIMPVHIYGHSCDMDPILDIAEDHNLYVIEDAAEAIGTEYKGKKAGSVGTCGTFSFYANKALTCGEGGMLVTNDEKIAERAQILMNHGFTPGTHFLHHYIGFNFRMTSLQAAIGLAQLERISEFLEAKRRNAALYTSLLKDIPGLTLPVEMPWCKNSFWMYGILVDEDEFGIDRDELQKRLEEKGIETRIFFKNMHSQPVYQKMGLFPWHTYPVADMLEKRGVYLPSSTKLTEEEIRYVCDAIRAEVR
ncbi:MAG: DegT/DnrJ/EryC1/StrS family aminotransferase, partial [Methanocellales archaeon]|nr:DegT/DnrJ/EryC1/StrS family aminotransferase [Methanocellales archaeon]